MALSEIESELSKLMGSLKRGPPKRKHVASFRNSDQSLRDNNADTGIKRFGGLAGSPLRYAGHVSVGRVDLPRSIDRESGIKSFGTSAESTHRASSVGGKRAWELSQVW
jgi:hypothetical protein